MAKTAGDQYLSGEALEAAYPSNKKGICPHCGVSPGRSVTVASMVGPRGTLMQTSTHSVL